MIRKKIQRRWMHGLIILMSLTQFQCANFLEPMTPKDTNEAYLYSARKKITNGEYLKAIEDLIELEPGFAANNDVRVTFASAYAGACGMEFIPFFNNISQANLDPPNTFFKYLRGSFTNRATTPSYCILAEKKLKEIGATEALRLTAMAGKKEVNMVMAILSMAKMGSILRTKSDVDGADALGDGITDGGFDSCTNNEANFTDDEIIEVATGFGLFFENISSLMGNGSDVENTLNTVKTVIGQICDLVPDTKCVILDPSDIDLADKSELVDTYRDLLSIDILGIGSCDLPGHPDLDTCCP